MNKTRKAANLLNVFQYDEATGAVTLPSTLSLTAPHSSDDSGKVITSAWVRSHLEGRSFLTGNQAITFSGDISGSGTTNVTLTLANSGATAGSYGSASAIPVLTVDAKGRVTSISTTAVSIVTTLAGLSDVQLATLGNAQLLQYNSATSKWVNWTPNYATTSYVDTAVSNLVNAAPTTLDTLSELATALGNDANFATTIAASIGTKQAQLNGTGFVKVSGTTVSYDNSTYLTSFTETDPTVPSHVKSITTTEKANWNTAYGWGNHASAGYLTTATASTTYLTQSAAATTYLTSSTASSTYLTQSGASATYLTQANASNTYASLSGAYANPAFITSLAYSKITGVPAFLTSYTETDTLATVTARGASTSTTLNLEGRVNIGNGLTRPAALNSDSVAHARIGGSDVHLYIASLGAGGGYKVAVQAARTSDFASFSLDLQSNGGTLLYGGNEVATRSWVTSQSYLTGITSGQVTGALGYTPYNSSNPSGYITGNSSVSGWVSFSASTQGTPIIKAVQQDTGSGFYLFQGVTGSSEVFRVDRVGDIYMANNLVATRSWVQSQGYVTGSYLSLSGGTLTGPLQIGTSVYTTSWNDGGGSYIEAVGNSTATRKLRVQAYNGSSAYAQWFVDGGNLQVYGAVSDNVNFLMNSSTTYLRWNGSDRFWTGSDGTRNSGWAYHENNNTGLHWPNNGWHFYPKDVNDMFVRSGSTTNVALAMNTAGTVRGYVYAENDNTIGFLTNNRGWAFRTYSNGDARVYGYLTVVGAGTSSSIYMSDSDEGQREIHCNSNRIGFLTQAGSWGAYCDDSGNWFANNLSGTNTGDQTNVSGYSTYLPTAYAGGQQTNPQVYFNNGIGLKAAMTGSWSVWSDTLWVNGYAGGDVKWMCALHFLRNSEPRMAISAQQHDSSSYGSYYEVITAYNIASQSVSYSNNSGSLNGWGYTSYAYRNSGTGYYQVNDWVQMNGTHGIFWPSYYGLHIRPNITSSYTQMELIGSKGGYGGIHDNYSAVQVSMFDSGGNGGTYREANGRWYWYYHLGNACMGINGSTTSGSYAMYVNGNIYATGDIVAYSDRRKKENIHTVDAALDKVLNLRGVFYNKKDDSNKKRLIGVIAQETEQVLPEVVTYAADIDEYGVTYGNMAGLFIEAIKEQQKQIEDLKKQIEYLVENK